MARKETAPALLRPEDLRRISDLGLIARWIVEGTIAGLHRSPFHGFSAEFAEYREYVAGDDLRRFDWKAYGRSDRSYIKKFHSETNLACHILLDGSPSMAYGDPTKFEYARALAAAVIHLVLGQGDAAGLVLLGGGIELRRPPASGPRHRKELFEALARKEPARTPPPAPPDSPATRLGPAFHDLAELVRRRGLFVILSDLHDDEAAVAEGIRHLRFRGHEVVLFHVLHRSEIDLDIDGLADFVDLETGGRVQAYAPSLRDAYRERMRRFIEGHREACNGCRADYELVDTREPFAEVLARYLGRRFRTGGA